MSKRALIYILKEDDNLTMPTTIFVSTRAKFILDKGRKRMKDFQKREWEGFQKSPSNFHLSANEIRNKFAKGERIIRFSSYIEIYDGESGKWMGVVDILPGKRVLSKLLRSHV